MITEVIIKIGEIDAITDGDKWICTDKKILVMLNTFSARDSIEGYTPSPAYSMALLAEKHIKGTKIVSTKEEIPDVDERIY